MYVLLILPCVFSANYYEDPDAKKSKANAKMKRRELLTDQERKTENKKCYREKIEQM